MTNELRTYLTEQVNALKKRTFLLRRSQSSLR